MRLEAICDGCGAAVRSRPKSDLEGIIPPDWTWASPLEHAGCRTRFGQPCEAHHSAYYCSDCAIALDPVEPDGGRAARAIERLLAAGCMSVEIAPERDGDSPVPLFGVCVIMACDNVVTKTGGPHIGRLLEQAEDAVSAHQSDHNIDRMDS